MDELTKEIEAAKMELLVAIARLEKLMGESIITTNRSVENMRAQNSAEHGSLFSKMEYLAITTSWIKRQWERFSK